MKQNKPRHQADREAETVTLLSEGLSVQEVAGRLGISRSTVWRHRKQAGLKSSRDGRTLPKDKREFPPPPSSNDALNNDDLSGPQFSLDDWQRLKDAGLNSLLIAARAGSASAANHLSRIAIQRLGDLELENCENTHVTIDTLSKCVADAFDIWANELRTNLLRVLDDYCQRGHEIFIDDSIMRVGDILERYEFPTVRDGKIEREADNVE